MKGSDAVVRFAARHGFEFTAEEFRPVMQMLRFLHDATRDEALQSALRQTSDDDAVAAVARDRGYEFTAAELVYVSVGPAEDATLSDRELEAVAGGAGIDQQLSAGLRVQFQDTRDKTTTGASFSEIAASGLSKSADAVLSAGQVAAPYIPGGSVLSAAMSG